MSLSPVQLASLAEALAAAPAANPMPALRHAQPGVAITRCDPEDMRGEPAFGTVAGFLLYLVDTAGHCWRIVDQPDQATGVVLALAPRGPEPGASLTAAGEA